MIRQQLIRYATVGLVLNAILYGAYLLLAHSLMESRVAMTVTYATGVLTGYMLNRAVAFRFSGRNVGPLLRYIASYFVGYVINFAALWFFVDWMGVTHEIVQGGVILALPAVLFVLQKYWVFSVNDRDRPALQAHSAP